MTATIRKVQADDVASLKEVIDANELFPSEYLDDMIHGFLHGEAPQDIWLTQEVDGQAVSIAYCAPEKMTEGTFNLYLIAVHPHHQSKGLGAGLIKHVEDLLRQMGHRVLLVETSGLEEFERTRKFYDQCHYTREAVIRDFYKEGEDKVVFWKRL
jgi:GNAT superfamily N-acetyltransferase